MKFLVWRASRELGTFNEEDFRARIFKGEILPTDIYWTGEACKPISEYPLAMPPPLPTPQKVIKRGRLKGLGLAIGILAIAVIVILAV